jgi:hypothetical protein
MGKWGNLIIFLTTPNLAWLANPFACIAAFTLLAMIPGLMLGNCFPGGGR